MYEGLRLVELHEEWAWSSEAARRFGGGEGRAHAQQRDRLDAEIRARVAAQEIRPPFPFRLAVGSRPASYCGVVTPLLCGIPDAEREYPLRVTRKAAPLRSWVNHATHVIPAEGCHLCREGRL